MQDSNHSNGKGILDNRKSWRAKRQLNMGYTIRNTPGHTTKFAMLQTLRALYFVILKPRPAITRITPALGHLLYHLQQPRNLVLRTIVLTMAQQSTPFISSPLWECRETIMPYLFKKAKTVQDASIKLLATFRPGCLLKPSAQRSRKSPPSFTARLKLAR